MLGRSLFLDFLVGSLGSLLRFFNLPDRLVFLLQMLLKLLDVHSFLVLLDYHLIDLGLDVQVFLRPVCMGILHFEDAHVGLVGDHEGFSVVMLACKLELLGKEALSNFSTHLRVTPVLNESLLGPVEDEHEDVLVVHNTQLNALLDQPFLAFA